MLRTAPARLYVRWSARYDTNNISTKQRRLGERSAEWHAHDSDDERACGYFREHHKVIRDRRARFQPSAYRAISHAIAPRAFVEKAPAVVVLLKTSANGASSRFWMMPRTLLLASSRPKSAGFNYIPSRERASEHAASGAQTGGRTSGWSASCQWDRHRVTDFEPNKQC